MDYSEEAEARTGRETRPLPEITKGVPALMETEKVRSKSWTVRSGLQRWLQENWIGKLSQEAKDQARLHYATLANVFLRDIPLTTRARITEGLVAISKHYLGWEKRPGAAHAEHHFLFGSTIHLERGDLHQEETMHEGMHVLQREGHLPYNHPLTYAITALVKLSQNQMEFIKEDEESAGVFKKELLDRDTYFQLVTEGRAHEAFTDGWILNPRDDEIDREFTTYLSREPDFEKEFSQFGEFIENRFGVRYPPLSVQHYDEHWPGSR
jgi:hypothetical protein